MPSESWSSAAPMDTTWRIGTAAFGREVSLAAFVGRRAGRSPVT